MAHSQGEGPATHVLVVRSGRQHSDLVYQGGNDGGRGQKTGQPGPGAGQNNKKWFWGRGCGVGGSLLRLHFDLVFDKYRYGGHWASAPERGLANAGGTVSSCW